MLDEILENKDDEPLETSETENEGTDSEPDVDENVKHIPIEEDSGLSEEETLNSSAGFPHVDLQMDSDSDESSESEEDDEDLENPPSTVEAKPKAQGEQREGTSENEGGKNKSKVYMDGHVIVHPRLEDLPKEETPENEGGNNGGSEHPHPQPQPEAPERGNLVNEEINEDLRDMALENLDENQAARRGENQDSNFDSLKDLKALKEKKSDENGENNDTDNAGDANETLEKVLEARKGNIYAAVVLAKGLERNESNPLASGRFSRFMNSSKVDRIFDANKLGMGVNGIISTFDEDYAKSKVGNGISLVVNLIGMVGSLRDLAKKIRAFRNSPKLKDAPDKKKDIVRNDTFAVIGMVADAATILLRVCGIAKAIAGLAGQGKSMFAKVTGYVSQALGGLAQIAGLSTSVNQMLKLKDQMSKTKAEREDARKDLNDLIFKYYSDTGGVDRTALALDMLEQDDITEEDKEIVVRYLMLDRKVGKINAQVRSGAFGLTTLATGLISTITGSVNSGLNNFDKETATDEQKKRGDAAKTANKVGATLANSAVILGASKNMVGEIINKSKKPSSVESALGNRATGILNELKDEKYGLKGIAASLVHDPGDEEKNNAKAALGKYAAADKNLQSLGVNYGVLLKSAKKKDFEQALIAGI